MIRPNTTTTCVLAIALLSPILVGADNNGNAPSDPDPLAAVKTARDALTQDQKTLDADRQSAKTACRNPGAECDAAKAKVQTDIAQIKTDKEDLRLAVKRAKDSGAEAGTDHPAQPKEIPRFRKEGADS